MKQRFTKLLAAVALLVGLTFPMGMWGQNPSWSHEFANGDTYANNSVIVNGATWDVSTAEPVGSPTISFGNMQKKYALKFGSSGTNYYPTITFSTDYFANCNVQSVTVNICNNGNKSGTLTVTQGSTTIGTASASFGQTWTDLTANTNSGSGGTLSFSYSVAQACGIHSITVVYTTGGSSTDPTITFSPTSVNVGSDNPTGTLITRTFTVSQSNLDEAISLSVNGQGSIDPTSIDQGADPTEVTWSYTPTVAGNINTTITALSGNTSATFSITGAVKQLYNVNIATGIEHGTVSADPMQAIEGQAVTLTVNSEQGYELTNITVEDQSGNNVEVNDNTFVMPNSNVVVNATFDLIPTTVSDELNREFTGVTGTSYTNWSGKTGTSGAVYAGNSAGGNNAIQLRSSDNSGIISTTSGGKLRAVKVTWNENTADGRTMDVYGSNTAYTATSNLYGNDSQGTKLGAIVYGTSTELTITGNYKYIGIRSKSGAMYLDEIEIQWVPSTDPSISAENVNVVYNATSGNIEYEINNPATNGTVTAEVTNGNWLTLGEVSESAVAFTCSANEAYTSRPATVVLTYTYGDNQTTTATVIVTQAGVPYPTTNYTLATSIESGRHYIIIAYDNKVAVGAQNGDIRYAVDGEGITVANNVASISDYSVYDFVINGPDGDGYYTIYDQRTGGFLVGGNKKLQLQGSSAQWNITFDNANRAIIKPATGNYTNYSLQYNSSSPRFACYDSSQTGVSLYVKDNETEYTYVKDITGYGSSQFGYTLIASPIDGVNPANVAGMTDGNFDLYRFNESADKEWENWKQEGDHNHFDLARGKGYLYAHKTDVTLAFAGTPVQGTTFDVTLSNSGTEYQGMNLVGNPFGQRAYVTVPFFVMNGEGSGFEAANRNYIEPMEGIIVDAANGTTLTFTTEAPSNSGDAKVALNLSRNRGDVIDRAIVRFGEGSQLHKFQLRENSTKVYFTEGNQDFAVVRSQKAQGEMPVNFKAEENGTYTLSVNTEEMELNYLHLIDNMTGMDVDLLQTPSYTFDATTNDYASRFRLVFSANDVNEQNAETFAFFSNGNWVVGNEGEATLQVIDVNGRIVSNETINGTVATSINATPGVYMLRLVNGNEVKTQKIVVK